MALCLPPHLSLALHPLPGCRYQFLHEGNGRNLKAIFSIENHSHPKKHVMQLLVSCMRRSRSKEIRDIGRVASLVSNPDRTTIAGLPTGSALGSELRRRFRSFCPDSHHPHAPFGVFYLMTMHVVADWCLRSDIVHDSRLQASPTFLSAGTDLRHCLEHFSRVCQLYATMRAPRYMIYLVTMLVGCRLVFVIRCYDQLTSLGRCCPTAATTKK